MTDVLLQHFPDGGNIQYLNGQVTTETGLATAAYLSLFGGNERDRGIEGDDRLQWWGNFSERIPERKYRSRTQALVRSMPLIPANLRRVENAAGLDLEWFVTSGPASFVRVLASIPTLNCLRIDVEIVIGDETFRVAFLAASPEADLTDIGITQLLVDDFGFFIIDDGGNFITP